MIFFFVAILCHTSMYLTVPPGFSGGSGPPWTRLDPIGPPNEKTIVRRVDKRGCTVAHPIIEQLSCSAFHSTYQQRPPPSGCREDIRSRRTIEFVAIEPKAVAIIRTVEPWLVTSTGCATIFIWWNLGLRKGESGWSLHPYPACQGQGLPFTTKAL